MSSVGADLASIGAGERSVLIAHPGAAHFVYELVTAVAELGYRTRFETGFYYDCDGPLSRLVGWLPPPFKARVDRELRRRSFAGLEPALVHRHPDLELTYVAAARGFRTRPGLGRAVMGWRNRAFDGRVARRIEALRPQVVIGYDTSSLATLKAARAAGAVAVLNQMIGHLAVGDAILRDEAERHPEFADSLHAGAPDWLIEQCRQEALAADHVLAPSDYVARTLIEIGVKPQRIHALPFGVRIDRFRPTERIGTGGADGRLRLLFVGQISQRKGIKYLLQAMERLNRSDLELMLVGGVVGSGAGLKPFRRWFEHRPNVPHAEVQALFQSADLFVYPSLHEGSALAIFEAMACGLPVITTENAGSAVRHGQDGLIVPIRDPDALAEAIASLADDPQRRGAMAQSARRRAEAFTWADHRRRLGALLADW